MAPCSEVQLQLEVAVRLLDTEHSLNAVIPNGDTVWTCDIQAGDAADLKVSSSSWRVGAVKLLLKLVNWVWELETLPTAWSRGDR
jgi:hypothetical protein